MAKPVRRRVGKPATTRKVVRGASKSRSRREDDGRKIPVIRSLLAVGMVVGLVFLGNTVDWQGYSNKVKGLVNRPIENVAIEGEFNFLDKALLYQVLTKQGGGSFVNLNIGRVKYELEAMPWVESVNVSRIWPDGMRVSVVEQKPIARWGEEGFINQFGDIIKTDQSQELSHLPVLYGDETMGREITRTYMDVAALFSGKGIALRGLELDSKRAWTLVVNNDLKLVLGRAEVIEKLRNFLFVYEKQLNLLEPNIEKIDMRYESGLAVEWKREKLFETSAVN